ncbi:MAG: protein kinase [Proteobacteria bacterium]|nr:protein kinase [Pseudomonadota bacterium]MBU1583470.1 protein kinase [Pseudomonadota bacterium]MBU2452405.1 protein kinase [Pseudomonadota bacterium]MBU2628465.1 protein kinase [Pseudomonadota bacterium]
MPNEDNKLDQKILVKSPGSSKYSKSRVIFPWQDRHITVKKTFGSRQVDLAEVYYWKFKIVTVPGTGRGARPEPHKAVALTFRERGRFVDWHFVPDHAHSNTWLYWILESLRLHHRHSITEREIGESGLTRQHKGEMLSRIDQVKFGKLYKTFVETCNDLAEAKQLPGFRAGAGNARYIKGLGSAREYGTSFKKLKAGGSGTSLFSVSQKQRAIRLDDEKTFFQPPDEPVVVKVASILDICGDVLEAAIALVKEFKILGAIGAHPNIIGIVDAIPARDGIYVFLEAGIEDLEDRATRQKLPQKEVLPVCYGIIDGLAHMHERSIFHLDMKPANVLFFKGDVPKIIDFGLTICKGIHDRDDAIDNWHCSTGTKGYVPPESFVAKSQAPAKGLLATYMAKRDTYAVGMTFLDSLIGPVLGLEFKSKQTFLPTDLRGAKEKQVYWEKALREKLPAVHDPEFLALCSMTLEMIAWDVNRRPTIVECRDMFQAGCAKTVQKYRAAVKMAQRKKQILRARKALVTYEWIRDAADNDLDTVMALIKYNENRDV